MHVAGNQEFLKRIKADLSDSAFRCRSWIGFRVLANQMGLHPQPWYVGEDLNWGMDMRVRDGKCRSRKDHPPANFTPLKDMADNLARTAPGKDFLRLKRKAAPRDDEFLASLTAAELLHPEEAE